MSAACGIEIITDGLVDPVTPPDPIEEPEVTTHSFKVSSEGTKSYLTDDYNICWEAGKDMVSIFSKTSNYRFKARETGVETVIAGNILETTSRYYAVYPYDPDATNSTGFVTTTLPERQKAVANQYSNILAVGSTQTDVIFFRNCVTLIEVDLQTDGVKTVSLRGNNGELIAGTVRISIPSSGDKEPVTTVISGSKEVYLADEEGKALEKGLYYLAVIPQYFSKGVTITLSGDGGSAVRQSLNPVTAERSKRLPTGPLDVKLIPADAGFSLSFDDGLRSGTIYPGDNRTLLYTYSGTSNFNYKVRSGGSFTQQVFFDGSETPAADFAARIGDGFNSASGTVDIKPCQSSGGYNANVARLQSASSRGLREQPVDLSTDNNNTLGAGLNGTNTANCYIVRAPGWYSFPLVYGNAIKNGSANSGAYAPASSSSSMMTPFVDSFGNSISSPYISDAASVRLEWQDALGLIGTTELAGNGDGSKIVFEVPGETIREGNAVISALDAHGRVLWSWHIWVTGAVDSDLSPITVTNKAGSSYRYMRINLGWVAPYDTPLVYPERSTKVRLTEDGSGKVIEFTLLQLGAALPANELGNCPFFQWGRKDPFVSSDGTQYGDNGAPAPDNTVNFRKKTWFTGDRRDTVGTRAALLGNDHAAFIRNPSVYNVTSGGDNKYVNAWNATQDKLGSTDTIVKTVYDPCPVGFCLPPISAWSAFSTSNTSGEFTFGWNFHTMPDKGGETLFFPACGSMSTSNNTSTSVFGALRSVGYQCSYWTGNVNQLNAGYYLYSTATAVNTNYGANRQYVYPIRPAMEQ